MGNDVMIFDTETASVLLDVRLGDGEFLEGSVVEAVVRGLVRRDLIVSRGELTLIKTVTYHHRQGNPYGGFYTVPTRLAEVICRQVLRAGSGYRAGELLSLAATLTIPSDGPGSVSAKLVRIEWSVHAHVEFEGQPDANATREIVVLSRSAERASVEENPPVIEGAKSALLGFQDLSSRRLVPGVPVSGVLTVAPRLPMSARSARVELVLREQVEHGPWIGDDPARNPSDQGKESDTVVAAAQLANRLVLQPDQPRRFPFSVPVPPRLTPSMQTPEFTLSWILRGVLDRALHQDPSVEIELHGVTTPD
jgi:hypothetical protein